MKEAKSFIEEGVHPQVIIKAYRKALELVGGCTYILALLKTLVRQRTRSRRCPKILIPLTKGILSVL